MALIATYVLDGACAKVQEATRLDICRLEPTTYTQATSTYTLGNKTSPTIGAPATDGGTGRKVTVSAITDGTVTDTSTTVANDAEFWALTDVANSRLLVTGTMAAAQFVTSGNTFTLTAFDVTFPGAA